MKVAGLEILRCDAGWRNYHFLKLTTAKGIVGSGGAEALVEFAPASAPSSSALRRASSAILKTARLVGCGSSTVQRIKREKSVVEL